MTEIRQYRLQVPLFSYPFNWYQWRRNRGLGGALASPEVKKISGKNLIIKEKFRVFLENLGIRGKNCNILFKKCMSGKFFC